RPPPTPGNDGAATVTRGEAPTLAIAAAQAPDLAGCVELLEVLAREAAGKSGDDYLALLAHSQEAAARQTRGQRVAVVATRPEELSRRVGLLRAVVARGAAPAPLQAQGVFVGRPAAGVLSFGDGLRAMRERTLAVLRLQTSDPGQMVALACGVERAAELLRELPGYAAIAADNAPSACIVSADGLALTELLQRAGDEGVEATVLAVSHGYHSQLIAGACAPYRGVLSSLGFGAPRFDVVSSITGTSIRALPAAEYPAQLERQYVEPVRLRPAVETLYASGVRLFVE